MDIQRDGAGESVAAIIVAAGASSRAVGLDKMFVPLMGRPLISYSIDVFNNCPLVGEIVLVMASSNIERGRRLAEEVGWLKVRNICLGGNRRQDSVRRGMELVRHAALTVVHDGARPCVDAEMITRGLTEVRQTGAATAAVPVKDTIKSVGSGKMVKETLDRDRLWAVQTPQVFRSDVLYEAHKRVTDDVTDDASMIELMGGDVRVFMGSYENIKVTTPEDIPIAEAVLKARMSRQPERAL